MGKNPHKIPECYLLYLIINGNAMIREVKKRELYNVGMAMLAIMVVFVLLLNLFILFDLY